MQALLVVDVQNEFSPEGLRPVPNHALAMRAIRGARRARSRRASADRVGSAFQHAERVARVRSGLVGRGAERGDRAAARTWPRAALPEGGLRRLHHDGARRVAPRPRRHRGAHHRLLRAHVRVDVGARGARARLRRRGRSRTPPARAISSIRCSARRARPMSAARQCCNSCTWGRRSSMRDETSERRARRDGRSGAARRAS